MLGYNRHGSWLMKSIVGTPLLAMVGANSETALCVLLIGGNLLLLTSKLIMPKTAAPSHPRGGSDLAQVGTKGERYYEWLVSN